MAYPADRLIAAEPVWGLVLAGGGGPRLGAFTRRATGAERPKQFCRVLGGETLLEQTLRRTARLVPPGRTLAVVVHDHEPFYGPLVAGLPSRHVVVQPENRGTAPAILYSALRVSTLHPRGPLAIFPSDHYVSDDETFMAHVKAAVDVVSARPDLIVLLGIAPDTAETEYGWIEPGDRVAGPWRSAVSRIRRFSEKPSPALAEMLQAGGGLWNTFVMVAYPSSLISSIRSAVPGLVHEFAPVQARLGTPWEDESVRRAYAGLPSIDFSSRVLGAAPANLVVLPVRGVEWSDLGNPRRVEATLARISLYSEGAFASFSR